jgi:hypothetical protein
MQSTQPALFGAEPAASSRRTQYVFVYPCGCPRTVIEGSSVADADEALAEAAPLGAERHWLEVQGVRLIQVSHQEYLDRFSGLMRTGCPHQRDGR